MMPIGKKNILSYVLIVLWVLAIPVVAFVSAMDYKVSIMVLAGVIGLILAVITLLNYRVGYYILITVSLTVHLLERMSGAEIPVGILLDGLLMTLLAAIIFSRQPVEKSHTDYFRDPLLLILYGYTAYLLVQCLNPNMFGIQGWLVFIRVYIRNLIFLFITLRLMRTWKDIYVFSNSG